MDVAAHNRKVWDNWVSEGNQWTVPVTSAAVDAARRGDWSVILTPHRPVPRSWFGKLDGARVLCLASGGGQQAPILAAAGATVTVLDNSPAQLDQDRMVASRDGLELRVELGEMTDLRRFPDGSFDLIFHPVANCFISDLAPLWRECHRVLAVGGRLLAGFCNPVLYLFSAEGEPSGDLIVRHSIPYSDLTTSSPADRKTPEAGPRSLEFGHSLESQIGGQLSAGLVLTDMYEDKHDNDIDRYIPTMIATLAIRPR